MPAETIGQKLRSNMGNAPSANNNEGDSGNAASGFAAALGNIGLTSPFFDKQRQRNSDYSRDYESIANELDGFEDSDKQKYQAAVDFARDRLKNEDNVDDQVLKRTIDEEYAKLNPSNTGSDQRGENWFTNAIGDLNNHLDSANVGIGNGLDWIADNTVGNLLGLVSDDLGNGFKNQFNGEDLSVIPDVLETIGLAAIPGAGPWLALGKGALQNSTNLYEGMTGKDSVTQENLTDQQALGRLGSGVLGTALSAVPGAGKGAQEIVARGMAKELAKDGAKGSAAKAAANGASKAADVVEGAGAAPTFVQRLESKVIDRLPENIQNATAKIQNAIPGERQSVSQAIQNVAQDAGGKSGVKQAAKTLQAGGDVDDVMPLMRSLAESRQTLNAMPKRAKDAMANGGDVAKALDSKGSKMATARDIGGRIAGMTGMGALEAQGQYGGDLIDNIGRSAMLIPQDPGLAIMGAFTPGARRAAQAAGLANMRGANAAAMRSSGARTAAQSAGYGNALDNLLQNDTGEGRGLTDEEMIAAMRGMKGGS